jgi:hypothetical protein
MSIEKMKNMFFDGKPRLFLSDSCVAVLDNSIKTIFYILSESDIPPELEAYNIYNSIRFLKLGFNCYSHVVINNEDTSTLRRYVLELVEE